MGIQRAQENTQYNFLVLEKLIFCIYKFILPDSNTSSKIHPHGCCTQGYIHTNSLSHSQTPSVCTCIYSFQFSIKSMNLQYTPQTNTHNNFLLESVWGRCCLTHDPVRAHRTGQHPLAESSDGGGRGLKDVYSSRVYLYHGCCLALSVSSYLFSFFTSQYQPNLNDLNSIQAPKHLSLPYLWIMERFSGIQNFIESTPLRFSQSPLLLHCSISHISYSLNAHSKYIPHTQGAHIHEYIHACIPALFKPFHSPSSCPSSASFLHSLPFSLHFSSFSFSSLLSFPQLLMPPAGLGRIPGCPGFCSTSFSTLAWHHRPPC